MLVRSMLASVFVLLILGSPAAFALSSPVVTLDEALARTDANDAEIVAARTSVDVARARIAQVAAAPLNGTAATAFSNDVPGGVGSYQTLDLGAEQTVTPGRSLRARRAAAMLGVRVAQASAEAVRRDVRLRMIAAYFGLLGAQDGLDVARSDLELAVSFADVARRRYEAGDVGRIDVLRAEADAERGRTAFARAEQSVAVARVAFAVFTGSTTPRDAIVVEPSFAPTPRVVSAGDVQASSVAIGDPTAAQYAAQIAQSVARESAARAARAPSFSYAVGAQVLRTVRSGATSGGPTASVSVLLPLVDHGTLRGVVDEERAAQAQAQAQLAARAVEVRAQLETREAEAVAGERRASDAASALSRAREVVRLTRLGYRRGKLGIVDVLSARSALSSAVTAWNEARIDGARARAEIGELLRVPAPAR